MIIKQAISCINHMNINSLHLASFRQLSIDRNFHKAALNLCITQSALSQRISKLEEQLSCLLFIRSSTGLELTQEGKLFQQYADDAFFAERQILTEIEALAESKYKSVLRIAAYSSILRSAVIPSLQDFIMSNPSVQVEFVCCELYELEAMLHSGEVDMILSDRPMVQAGYESHLLGYENLVHVVPKHRLSDDLVFLDHDELDQTTFDFFKRHGVPYNELKRHYYDDIYGILDAVRLGLGQAIVSEHLLNRSDELHIIKYDVSVCNPVTLFYPRVNVAEAVLQGVVDALSSQMPHYLLAQRVRGKLKTEFRSCI